tara:strand:- start:350 stop:529 length:180 start_codon:yes stop_codon:yes gene_type:complete
MPKNDDSDRDTLMHNTRAALCAAEAGIVDPMDAFMAVFHPEVDRNSPRMIALREERKKI